MGSYVPLVLHTVAIICLLAAYVVVTVTGHDGTAILGVTGGYLGGAGVQTTLNRAEESK